MKRPLTLVLMLAVFFCISGCGPEKLSGNANGSAKKEIVMWLIGSEGEAVTIRGLAAEFYKKTGVNVKCEAISWGDAHSKYLTSIAGGVAPDIGTIGLTWGAEFGKFDSMVDLKAAYPDEIKLIKGSVFSGLWDSIESEGKVYGIPFDMTEYVLYYRNDIISTPPGTWEELTALLADLNKKDKGMLFDWGSMSWIGYSPFLWQAGGDYFNRDFSQVTINSAEAVTALKFFASLYTKYNVPKTKIPLEQGMRSGDLPIAISGNWKIEGLSLSAPEIAGKWSIATMPKGPTGKMTAFIGGRIMGIFAQSKNKEASWEFIKFLFRPENQKELYEAAQVNEDTYLPPTKRALDTLKMDPGFKRVLISQAQDAKGPPPIANWESAAKYIDEAIQKVILQNGDPKKELDTANRQLSRMFKK